MTSSPLRILFATDLHGSTNAFRSLLALGADPRLACDAIVVGGDLSGKVLVPVLKTSTGAWMVNARDNVGEVGTAERRNVEAEFERTGSYGVELDDSQFDELQKNEVAVEERLQEVALARLLHWDHLTLEAGAKHKAFPPVFVGGGNDDYDSVLAKAKAASENGLRWSDSTVVDLPKSYQLLSFGYSTPTPWETPRELPEDDIADRLGTLGKGVKDWGHCVANIHVPPQKSGALDIANALTSELTFDSRYHFAVPGIRLDRLGQPKRIHVGSLAVRRFLEFYRPPLALTGHIHEACGWHVLPDADTPSQSEPARDGTTTIISPGSLAEDGVLRAYYVVLDRGRVVYHVTISR